MTEPFELSIVMPCLNEARTVGACIEKALRFLAHSGIRGEILLADNGSTDGSRDIARATGARVVEVGARGYGAALIGGIEAAEGRYIIMGDADDSYDFTALAPFVEKLRDGYQLVVGNRFAGGVLPGAMPLLHRYLGNPVLSYIGRLFFRTPIRDFHCGLRGFDRNAILNINLHAPGMEFASEMIVKASLAGLRITEVPTTLAPDGRGRPPHLRTWRDGWRHLSFMLIFSPRWLFFYPGILLAGLGIVGIFLLLPGSFSVGVITFGIHTFIVACVSILLGLESIGFAFLAQRYGQKAGFIPTHSRLGWTSAVTLEKVLLFSAALLLLGLVGFAWCVGLWASVGFGTLGDTALIRALTLSLMAVAAAIQLIFTAFLGAVMDIPS